MQEEKGEEKSYNDFESQYAGVHRKEKPAPPGRVIVLSELDIETYAYAKLKEGVSKTKVAADLTEKGVERMTAIKAAEKYALIVQNEIDAAAIKPSKIVLACLGGLAGAMIGGFIWGWIGMLTGKIYSAIAIGIGVLSGIGALLGSRGIRGPLTQFIAGIASIFGVLFGTYYIVYSVLCQYAVQNGITDEIPFFSPKIIQFFIENYSKLLSPFDYVFMLIAIATAWGIPKDMHSK